MKPTEIVERNKEIAIMLGWKKATLEYQMEWCGVPTEERLKNLSENLIPSLMRDDLGPLWDDSLEYHLNWNSLILGVDFVERLRYGVEFTKCFDDIAYGSRAGDYWIAIKKVNPNCSWSDKGIIYLEHKDRKLGVFIAISDFAKLYNENKL